MSTSLCDATTMQASGHIRKMHSEWASPVVYTLPLDQTPIELNALLGQQLCLYHNGQIRCVACDRPTKKSFQQGHCYPCFKSLARCDRCIMAPEHCHFHLGTCREPKWGQAHCMQSHRIYLANSSGLKVGITRATQIPTRWIDQGAVAAMAILSVDSRYHSGLIEVAFKDFLADRTNWRKMLKNDVSPIDLVTEAKRLLDAAAEPLAQLSQAGVSYEVLEPQPVTIEYPVLQYPSKVTSLSFDKSAEVSGQLLGIKGQYLILDTGVINMRKFSGYHIDFEAKTV